MNMKTFKQFNESNEEDNDFNQEEYFNNISNEIAEAISEYPDNTLIQALRKRSNIYFELDKNDWHKLNNSELQKMYSENFEKIKNLIPTTKKDELNDSLVFAVSSKSVSEMVNIAKLIIDAGADVNSRNKDFDTPVIVSAADYPGSLELIKYLTEHNSDINNVGKGGKTALSEAAEHCYDDILKYLINKKANLDIQEKYYKGDTALIRSIKVKTMIMT